jgi:uncharacterized membrane protein
MEFIFYGLLLSVIFFGPWIGLAILRHRLRSQQFMLDERFSTLTQRLFQVESTLQNLQRDLTSKARPVDTPVPAVEQSAPAPRPVTENVERKRVEPVLAPKVAPPPLPITRPPAIPVDLPRPTPVVIKEPAPSFTNADIRPALAEKIRQSGGIEEFLGKNLLNKIGIVLTVIGIAFLISTALQTLGPTGKVLLGYTVSLAMLGAGIWFERNDRYRILARAGIAGGWALLFFTTYAMYHVPAAHVLSSQALDLVLMLIVALAMVWHTLRYNSQVVTGLAFLLAYSTIFISRVNVYSLTAGVVLAIGIVLITLKRNWFELEIFGILASYLNHYFWLRPIIEPMGGQKHAFAEFLPSAAILISYWLIYRISYVVRRVTTEHEEQVSTVAGLLNSVLLMAILKYQAVHPEWAFWALLAFGAVEITLGQLPITRKRRTAFIVLSTIGAVLLVAAIPFRYSGAHVSVIWLLEAEAFFLVGVWTNERLFSRLGMLASFATAGQMLAYEAARVFGRRIDSADLSPDYRVGLLVVGVGAVVLYTNAHYFARRWSTFFDDYIDRRLLFYSSYAAAALATVSLWMAFPELWTAVAWSAFALVLAIVANKRSGASQTEPTEASESLWKSGASAPRYSSAERGASAPDLAIQANAISIFALVRVLAINFESTQHYHHISLRLVTIAAVAILFYITSRWTAFARTAHELHIPDAYTWTASTLVAVLIWYELQPISVAVAWCLFGVLLFDIGVHQRRASLRWQGYVALVSSFLRVFFVNLNAEPIPGDISARVYTIIPLAAAFFYIYTRRNEVEPSTYETYIVKAQSWMGTLTIAALVRFELPANWVVTGWAVLIIVLLAITMLLHDRVFQQQGILLAIGVLFRALFHNFYSRGPQQFAGWSVSSIAVLWAVLALFASLYFAFRLREKELPQSTRLWQRAWNFAVYRPEQTLFFVPLIVLTVLLAVEMRKGLTTVSWGLEAVAVFLFALWVGERSFRLSGLALLLLCVGKIVIIDVWGLGPNDRYLTFIIMGGALLLVSFLYTRYRETIKAYL